MDYVEVLLGLGNPAPDLSQITIGVSVFDRPKHLEAFIASARAFYPGLPIMVVDNGFSPCSVEGVEYHRLPVDCGLSACRNFMLDNCKTEYLLVCEEDFVFTEATKLGSLLDVLQHDSAVGIAAGSLKLGKAVINFSKSFKLFQDQLEVVDNQNAFMTTENYVPYRYADWVYNFFLCRCEAFPDIRWDEELKLGEHLDHNYRVFKSQKWRVAQVPSVVATHNVQGRDKHYTEHRHRAVAISRQWQEEHHLKNNSTVRPAAVHRDSVIVYGVGHSGTSIVAKLLHILGWERLDADERYSESVEVRNLNRAYFKNQGFNHAKAVEVLTHKHGWAIKDPRFVETLPLWVPVFQDLKSEPLLLWLQKDRESVANSYLSRNELVKGKPGVRGLTLDELWDLAQKNYDLWPWRKMIVRYEDVGKCFEEFQPRKVSHNEAC